MMNEPVDLTAITTPFGLLDEATQAALMAHGGPYEYWSVWTEMAWSAVGRPEWRPHTTYRVRPAPVEPPKPREWWIELNPNGSVCCTHDTKPPGPRHSTNQLVHVVPA